MKKLKYVLIGVVALGILGAILNTKKDLNNSKNEEKGTSLNQFTNYFTEVDQKVSLLTAERKAGREKLLQELKTNSIYKKLVIEKVISPEYLPTLNAISSSVATINNETFGIDEQIASNIETSNNGNDKIDFVIKVTSLAMSNINGGLTTELVDVFNRYKNKYKIYGDEGILFDENKNQTKIEKFDLTGLFVLLDPKNEDYLNWFYEAKQKGLSNWIGKDENYIYPFLTNKADYIEHVKKNNPNSPYIPKVDFEINAVDLFEAFNTNEVAADELYNGKKLLVVGVVNNIGKDVTNTPYLSLEIGYLKSINCYFSEKNKKELSKLNKGDRVQIIGKCSGLSLTSVIIKKCELWE